MTVIAYKKGIVAADTASWRGDVITGVASKIWRLPDGSIFASAGWKPVILRALDWIVAGVLPESRPAKADDGDLDGILIRPSGTIFFIAHTFDFFESDTQDIAVAGSHSEFLMGAMLAGASAESAVRLAVGYCRYAACEVQVEYLNE